MDWDKGIILAMAAGILLAFAAALRGKWRYEAAFAVSFLALVIAAGALLDETVFSAIRLQHLR